MFTFLKNTFADFATEHRGWFVLFFVLPFSLVFDVYFKIRAWIVMQLHSAPALHKQRLAEISKQIQTFHKKPENQGKKLCTARGGWQSISPSFRPYKNRAKKIEINLYDILDFNEEKMEIKVEPMVNMGQLSHFLIPKGYTIPVLPEMDDLTCGGLLMGVGIETSSHKYGLFNDSVVEAEVILASGEVVTCSKTKNRELFDALPWSYGTFGFLVSLKIRVIPCKPYVKMWYIPGYTAKSCSDIFKACCHKQKSKSNEEKINLKEEYFHSSANKLEFDFVEGLMYSRNKLITMPAKFYDKKDIKKSKLNNIGLWFKPWFYKHVQSFFSSKFNKNEEDKKALKILETDEIENFLDERYDYEFIPLRDYYHRHTKSIFWELEEIIPFGNHWIIRYFLGWALPPKVSFLKITQTQRVKELYEKFHCIQDMMVPESTLDESLDVFNDNYGIYPLWVCPYRAYDYQKLDALENKNNNNEAHQVQAHRCFLKKPENILENEAYELYVDLGAYGVPKVVKDKGPDERYFNVIDVSRKVEQFVHSVHGFQMLYATSYQDREEFREMFDHSHYDLMKKKYDPHNSFPRVYEKVCKKAMKLWESGEINQKSEGSSGSSVAVESE